MATSFKRSFADPLSSTLFVAKLDLQKWISDIALLRRFPVRVLPQLLHESTHHWCFNSPIGVALQLLSFRAANREISAMTKGDTSREAALSLFKTRFWQHLMLPFTEGLALFAEHDALAGDAPVISAPLYSAALLVAGTLANNKVDADRMFEHGTFILSLSRNSTEHYKRKTNLQLEPFSRSHSPYLCGYLAVKCLHYEAIRQNDIFVDADFFLYFLKSYLFDDWDAVDMLLSDSADDPEEIANRFFIHLQTKYLGFFQSLHKSTVDEFIRRGRNLSNERTRFEYTAGRFAINFFSDPVGQFPSARAISALRAGLDELFKPAHDEHSLMTTVRAVHISTLLLRNLLTLGRATFRANVARQSGRLMIWSEPGVLLSSLPPSKELPADWEGELTAVAALMPGTGQIHIVFLNGDSVVNVTPDVNDNKDFGPFANPTIDPHIRTHNLSVIAQVSEMPSQTADGWLSEIVNYSASEIDDFYTKAALLFTEDAEELASCLSEFGLLGALDGDLDLAEHLGCLSSSASAKYSPPRGSDAEKRLEEATVFAAQINQKLKSRFGFEPLSIRGQEVFFSML